LASIDAAELCVVQSKRNVLLSVDRTRRALRATAARPSSLVLVAVVAGIAAFFVARRFRRSVSGAPNSSADSTIRTSGQSLVRTFGAIVGVPVLTFALEFGAAAWNRYRSRVEARMPRASDTGDIAH
jgi:uncharacterized protein YjeT (DUF2065 family)